MMTNLCYIKHKYIKKNRKLHYVATELCYSEYCFSLLGGSLMRQGKTNDCILTSRNWDDDTAQSNEWCYMCRAVPLVFCQVHNVHKCRGYINYKLAQSGSQLQCKNEIVTHLPERNAHDNSETLHTVFFTEHTDIQNVLNSL